MDDSKKGGAGYVDESGMEADNEKLEIEKKKH